MSFVYLSHPLEVDSLSKKCAIFTEVFINCNVFVMMKLVLIFPTSIL